MLARAVMLAFGISALAAPAKPQTAPAGPAPSVARGTTEEVKTSGSLIRGRITSLHTGKPLRRAQVRLSVESDFIGTPRTASTSSDGRYEFRDVPSGRYTLLVERSGYLSLTYGQRRPGDLGRPLELADKEVAEQVD